jgi:hypothetical protein
MVNPSFIVDTNVAVVANDRPNEHSGTLLCVEACSKFLVNLIQSGTFVIDENWKIIKEYNARLNNGGQPGIGDKFLKWVLVNQANKSRCRTVNIEDTEVPQKLSDFDPSDMKFILTAVEAVDVDLVEALDSKWWHRREDFNAAGLNVIFLCPDDIRKFSEGKFGNPNDLNADSNR